MKSEKGTEERKEYPISDDIVLFSDKAKAAKKIRDLAVKLPLGYWKARKAAREEIYFMRKFWRMIDNVYPELKGKRITYDAQLQIVFIDEN